MARERFSKSTAGTISKLERSLAKSRRNDVWQYKAAEKTRVENPNSGLVIAPESSKDFQLGLQKGELLSLKSITKNGSERNLAEGQSFELSIRFGVIAPHCQHPVNDARARLKPAITLSRKDWHSAAIGAVLSLSSGRRRRSGDPAPPA